MNKEKSLVSIVIPTYNRKDSLITAVESCVKQNYANIEILVCDDHSTDDTEEAILKYMLENKKIKYYKVPEGAKGANEARNIGIMNSKGEYIAFLDSDDMLVENSISTRVEFFEKQKDLGMVYGNALGNDGLELEFEVIQKYKNPKKYMLYEMALCPFSVMMVRRAVFNDIPLLDNELLAWQDDGLVLSLVMNNKKILHSEQIVAQMYTGIGEANISSNYYKKYQGCRYLVNKYKNEIKNISHFRYFLWQIRILRDWIKAKEQKCSNTFCSALYNFIFVVIHMFLTPFFKKIWG